MLWLGKSLKAYFVIVMALIVIAGCGVTTSEDWCTLSHADGFSGVWKPKTETVPRLISDAKTYLEGLQENSQTGDYQKGEIGKNLKRWNDYRCQIIGYKKDGKKMIRLNFFPKSHESKDEFPYWRKDLVLVMDGGVSFWQADYDVTTGEIIYFRLNGYA